MLKPSSPRGIPRSKPNSQGLQLSLIDNASDNVNKTMQTQDSSKSQLTRHTVNNEFTPTLKHAYIECIAPNQKGNFNTAICIDELNGWLIAGQTSGTLNAWKIPADLSSLVLQRRRANHNSKLKQHVFECRNLMPYEEDGIRHIHATHNHIICMVGYRRLCVFSDYDEASVVKKKLGVEDVFTYSPFTSPHMFYSTQYEQMVYIFCRSFAMAMKVNLNTEKKEIIKAASDNKLAVQTSVLTANRNFIIWQSVHTKDGFWVKPENAHKNKRKRPLPSPSAANTNNRWSESHAIGKWLNQHLPRSSKSSKYEAPTLKKLQIRSLQNFNLVHDVDYFEPLPFNAWGFQLDNASMSMAYVFDSNHLRVVHIEADYNIMQYGVDYLQQPPAAVVVADTQTTTSTTTTTQTASNANNHSGAGHAHHTAVHDKKTSTNKKNSNENTHKASLVDALTLSYESNETSIESPSSRNCEQNENEKTMELECHDEKLYDVKLSLSPPAQPTPTVLHTLREHNGCILALEYDDGVLISMATDRKIIVWKHGRKIVSVSNIPGTFIPGYPYIIKKCKNCPNKIFYTADDGIFMVIF
eukprot:CAMPEP_0202695264 /NCGR_PEP_ID=MMETSP1385-20130828/8901_1 /ASSEMBLY_ACC=CAM_ASM_000861 /TAXON_ID=933848 /ORGANISM="Elphidium margaritaceum" /LENGTH=581 /DNA_ID=CAMNT_0049351263 /DNA_START=79 /DNA_END=1824 /DNA_ORIENTATION=-